MQTHARKPVRQDRSRLKRQWPPSWHVRSGHCFVQTRSLCCQTCRRPPRGLDGLRGLAISGGMGGLADDREAKPPCGVFAPPRRHVFVSAEHACSFIGVSSTFFLLVLLVMRLRMPRRSAFRHSPEPQKRSSSGPRGCDPLRLPPLSLLRSRSAPSSEYPPLRSSSSRRSRQPERGPIMPSPR
jgi:hypothetical protein